MSSPKDDRKVAVVTGSAGGIGRAIVSHFARAGYRVVALDRVRSGGSKLKADGADWASENANADSGSTDRSVASQYLECDLRDLCVSGSRSSNLLSQIQGLVGDAGLNVLVNNAASQVLGGVGSLTVADWNQTLDVNLLAPFVLTQGLLEPLEKANGCVINISSIHARLTKPNFVAYATCKAALSAMTRAMAVDLGARIRVNAIEPAAIETDMLRAGFSGHPDKFSELKACHPQGRIGTPEEVATLALSLASGELRFLHGACLGLDGGISARLHDPV